MPLNSKHCRVDVPLTQEEYSALKIAATDSKISMAEYIRRALRHHLKNDGHTIKKIMPEVGDNNRRSNTKGIVNNEKI